MITEKPSWVRHGGLQIFSVDVQPGGLRFATAGGDHKVRIWNMKSISKDADIDQSTQPLLATIRDHFGSVNCVRWAKHGRYVASGSDGQVILVHERKPGTGTIEFGSGEPPDIENWKVAMTLRGHTADVVDLNWSPDDSTLASCSLDNTVHIWNMSNGICTAVLRGHSSLVKGIAWDPIGSFIASQADDKTVIIWRTSDWSIEHRTEGHWVKSVGSTFFRRLGWSPCGHFITTTHGFQKPRHSAPVLERGDWSATFDFLGHNAPVVAVKFNNSMFKKSYPNGAESKVESAGWRNGTSKSSQKDSSSDLASKDPAPYNVIAIGSQDCTITVWTTASPRPLFVAKHYFTQSVVDLSWSPDGYCLFACSLDGTVATFHFEVKELGHRLTDSELEKLKRSRYGDIRGRQTNLAETPAQLLLEAAAVEQSANKKASSLAQQKVQLSEKPADQEAALIGQPHQKLPEAPALDEKKNEKFNAVNVGSNGGGNGNVNKGGHTKTSSPVKQREYRRPDGRKRIIPEAVGVPPNQENISTGALEPGMRFSHHKDTSGMISLENGVNDAAFKRPFGGSSVIGDIAAKCSNCGSKDQSRTTARAKITDGLILEKVSASTDGKIDLDRAGTSGAQASADLLSILVLDTKGNEDNISLCLEVKPVERTEVFGVGIVSVPKETEVTCSRGAATLWSDRLAGKATILAGNINFWAVGTEDGCLQVYTKCGRRAMPTIMTGSGAAFMDCDEGWKLLLVTKRGLLYVWDLFSRTSVVHDSLASLITSRQESSTKETSSIKVISVRFSKSGTPLVVLANRQAFLFDLSLSCWLRVADDSFPASNFSSSLNLGSGQGELAALQVDVGKYLARKPSWGRAFTDDGVQTRAHLEAQLASSLALKSPNEYRQCLLSYIRFLAREADESRLREVCETFLGPPTGMVADSSSSAPQDRAWDPSVLGMEKHKLLREDILPAMATNRKVQRLLNEFVDLLSEYEASANEICIDPRESAPSNEA